MFPASPFGVFVSPVPVGFPSSLSTKPVVNYLNRDIPATLDGIKVSGSGDRVTRVRAFPIGIDPERFSTSLRTEEVRNRIHHLRENFRGRKILVGIDRLDYVKGIPQKLHAFESFLQNHPEWVGRAVFVQLAIPTRPDVEDYQCLRSSVNEQVGRINGRFGSVYSVPLI